MSSDCFEFRVQPSKYMNSNSFLFRPDLGNLGPVAQIRHTGLSNPSRQTHVQDIVKTDVIPAVSCITVNQM